MQNEISYIWGVRQSILRAVRNFSNEQLNEIPHGFHNNLIWHMAHMVASQQDFFYVPSRLDMGMDPELYFNFRIGTRPLKEVSDNDIAAIKDLMTSSVSRLQADFDAGVFNNLANSDELLTHFVFHEGMHMAYILSIRRLLIYKK